MYYRMSQEEVNRIKVAAKIIEASRITVEQVMEVVHCNYEDANSLMRDLTAIGLATWDPVCKGALVHNPSFV